jgi:hypothetical protein
MKNRYTIKQHSKQPGQRFSSNDLEEAVKIATEKAKNTNKPFAIYDHKNKEMAGIVKPNGEIKRAADSVLGRSQNQAVNSGTIRIDKDALQEMIREAVARKLSGKTTKEKDREKEKKEKKSERLHKKTHKITKSQLKEAVIKATKLALIQEVSDLGIGSYSTKVDKLISESIDSIDKLVEEGENLMKENPTHDYAIQERNHMVQARIGILKGLKSQLVRIMEDLYRKV